MEDFLDLNILLDNNVMELFNEIEDLTTPLLTAAASSSIVIPSAIVTTIPTNTITTTNATDKNVQYQSNSRFVAVILTTNNSVAESLQEKNKETQQLLIDSKLRHNIEQILKKYWSAWSIQTTDDDQLYKIIYLQGFYVISRRSLRLLKSAVRTLLRKYRNNELLIVYEVITNNNKNSNKNNYITTWQIVKTLNCLYQNDENTIGTVRKGNTILLLSHEQQRKTCNNVVTIFEKTLFHIKADIIKCLWLSSC